MKLVPALLAGLSQAIHLEANDFAQTATTLNDDALELSQLQAEGDTFTCAVYHDRVRNGRNIFYGVQAGSSEYRDPTFPADGTMIRDAADATGDLVNKAATITFIPSIDAAYGGEKHSLFGDHGIRPGDVFQGGLGNCWFMHGAAAVAEKPARMEKVFLNNSLSSNGIYGFRFYVLGVPTTITIDDSLPLSGGKTIFAGVGKDGSLWGPLIEKAFAKLQGNYEALAGGDPRNAIQYLTGGPSEHYSHTAKSAAEVFALVKQANLDDGMISAGTRSSANGHDDRSAVGLAQGHAYTVLSAHEVTDASGRAVKLLRLRNPWGTEDYEGPFGDHDTANWDPTLQAQVAYVDDDDGTFFIDADTYHREFGSTSVNFDTEHMKQSFYLVQGDTSADGKHEFTVKATENQTVYLTGHVWPQRSYPDRCTATSAGVHSILYNGKAANHWERTRYAGDNTWYSWSTAGGQNSLSAITMAAGEELTVKMELDWKVDATRDFSLVAWSTGSAAPLIEAVSPGTRPPSTFPFTPEQANDMNAATQSGADACVANPAQTAFKTWYQGKAASDSPCGGYGTSLTQGNGDFYYAFMGSCGATQAISVPFTLPAAVWADMWINGGAKISSTTGSGDAVTKTFVLKAGTAYDRVAFSVKGTHGINSGSLSPPLAFSDGCEGTGACETVPETGNDPNNCPAFTTTDGTAEIQAIPSRAQTGGDDRPTTDGTTAAANTLAENAAGRAEGFRTTAQGLVTQAQAGASSAADALAKVVTHYQTVNTKSGEVRAFLANIEASRASAANTESGDEVAGFKAAIETAVTGVETALQALGGAVIGATAIQQHEFANVQAAMTAKVAELETLNGSCDAEKATANGLTGTTEQVAAQARTLAACTAVGEDWAQAQALAASVERTAASIDEFVQMNGAAQTAQAQAAATANAALEEVAGFLEAVTAADTDSNTITTPSTTCVDTDNGAADVDGDTCAGYTLSPSWCGSAYDDDDFTAMEMCCACKAQVAN